MKSALLNQDDTLLLVIDVQEKLLNAQYNREITAQSVAILAETCNIFEIPIIVTEQYPKGLGETISEVKTKLPKNTKFIEKTSFNCCDVEGFNELVRETDRKQIVVTGMETHICVFQTVNSLLEQGYQVYIVQDAVSSREKAEYELGLSRMAADGVVITSTETTLFELVKHSKHQHFKAIQNLIINRNN